MIRVGTVDDLPEIVAIYNEAVRARFATADLVPITVEQRMDWFHDHDPATYPIYVFDKDGTVLGWCALSAYRPVRDALRGTAEVAYYVRYDSHGQGIGSALVQHTVREARRLGKRVLLGVLLETNSGSIAVMKKCGFERWGRLPDVADVDGRLVSHLYYGRSV